MGATMARDIGGWLEEVGLGIYAESFAANEIDFDALPHLGEADLKELGLPMGPRKKLLAAISELGSGDAGVPEPTRREAERRQVTVLFADMVSFTSTSEKLGEEKTFALMERIFGLMAEAVREHLSGWPLNGPIGLLLHLQSSKSFPPSCRGNTSPC